MKTCQASTPRSTSWIPSPERSQLPPKSLTTLCVPSKITLSPWADFIVRFWKPSTLTSSWYTPSWTIISSPSLDSKIALATDSKGQSTVPGFEFFPNWLSTWNGVFEAWVWLEQSKTDESQKIGSSVSEKFSFDRFVIDDRQTTETMSNAIFRM